MKSNKPNDKLIKALLKGSESPYAGSGYISPTTFHVLIEEIHNEAISPEMKRFIQNERARLGMNKKLKSSNN